MWGRDRYGEHAWGWVEYDAQEPRQRIRQRERAREGKRMEKNGHAVRAVPNGTYERQMGRGSSSKGSKQMADCWEESGPGGRTCQGSNRGAATPRRCKCQNGPAARQGGRGGKLWEDRDGTAHSTTSACKHKTIVSRVRIANGLVLCCGCSWGYLGGLLRHAASMLAEGGAQRAFVLSTRMYLRMRGIAGIEECGDWVTGGRCDGPVVHQSKQAASRPAYWAACSAAR